MVWIHAGAYIAGVHDYWWLDPGMQFVDYSMHKLHTFVAQPSSAITLVIQGSLPDKAGTLAYCASQNLIPQRWNVRHRSPTQVTVGYQLQFYPPEVRFRAFVLRLHDKPLANS